MSRNLNDTRLHYLKMGRTSLKNWVFVGPTTWHKETLIVSSFVVTKKCNNLLNTSMQRSLRRQIKNKSLPLSVMGRVHRRFSLQS